MTFLVPWLVEKNSLEVEEVIQVLFVVIHQHIALHQAFVMRDNDVAGPAIIGGQSKNLVCTTIPLCLG